MKNKIIEIQNLKGIAPCVSYTPYNEEKLEAFRLYGVVKNPEGGWKSTKVDPREYVKLQEFKGVTVHFADGKIQTPEEVINNAYAAWLSENNPSKLGVSSEVYKRKVCAIVNTVVHELSEYNKEMLYDGCQYKDNQAAVKSLQVAKAQTSVLISHIWDVAKNLSVDENYCKAHHIPIGVASSVLQLFDIDTTKSSMDRYVVTPTDTEAALAIYYNRLYSMGVLDDYTVPVDALAAPSMEIYATDSTNIVDMGVRMAPMDVNPYNIPVSILKSCAKSYDFNAGNPVETLPQEVNEVLHKVRQLALLDKAYVQGTTVVPADCHYKLAVDLFKKDYAGSRSYRQPDRLWYDKPKFKSYEYKQAKNDGKHDIISVMRKCNSTKELTVLDCKYVLMLASYYKMYSLEEEDKYGDTYECPWEYDPAPVTDEEIEAWREKEKITKELRAMGFGTPDWHISTTCSSFGEDASHDCKSSFYSVYAEGSDTEEDECFEDALYPEYAEDYTYDEEYGIDMEAYCAF